MKFFKEGSRGPQCDGCRFSGSQRAAPAVRSQATSEFRLRTNPLPISQPNRLPAGCQKRLYNCSCPKRLFQPQLPFFQRTGRKQPFWCPYCCLNKARPSFRKSYCLFQVFFHFCSPGHSSLSLPQWYMADYRCRRIRASVGSGFYHSIGGMVLSQVNLFLLAIKAYNNPFSWAMTIMSVNNTSPLRSMCCLSHHSLA